MITDDYKSDEARIQTGHLKKSMISLQKNIGGKDTSNKAKHRVEKK